MPGAFFSQKPKPPPQSEDQVRLKPLWGIRPGVYLAAAGALVLLLILFFTLLYPGIARPGALVVFSSEPAGAALRVDNVYAGTAPCVVFVPRGEHRMEVILPGFEPEYRTAAIPSRLFASALFPRRYPVNVTLTAANPAAALAAAAYDYASWTFGGEPTAAWQIPLRLSEGVYRAGVSVPLDAAVSTGDVLAAAARFAVTRASLRDLVRAHTLAGNGGNAPSPLTLARSAVQAAAFITNHSGSAAWLADTLPADSAALLISSAWYQNQLAAFAGVTAGEVLAVRAGERPESDLPVNQIRLGGLLFSGVGGGVLVQGEPFPHQIPLDAFLMCTTEVPDLAYADFLDANPQWRLDQRETLEEQGLVDGEYLAGFEHSAPVAGNRTNMGVSAVSWYAAKAFCVWLSGKLPDSFSGWEVRLPSESEWEYAAKSVSQWGGANPFFALDGGAWEWCDDPYTHIPFLAAPSAAIYAVGSPEYPVRGGSWLNTSGSVNFETRASLPPAVCSAFVSFRPVIARINASF